MSGSLGARRGSPEIVACVPGINPQHSDTAEPRVVTAELGYELWAQSYDEEPNPLLALEERLLVPTLPDLKGSRVLDLACGTGRWLSTMVMLGASSGMGIDSSPAMLAVAASKPLLRGRLTRADCLGIPLPSAAVDLVVCSFAIGHIRNVEALAAELARVARPHAAIYVSDVHPDAYRRGWRTGFRSNGRPVEITTFSRTLEQIFEAFAAQGLLLAESIEGHLGDAERPVFERAGRLRRFHQLKGLPAIFIAHFGQTDPARRHRAQ